MISVVIFCQWWGKRSELNSSFSAQEELFIAVDDLG